MGTLLNFMETMPFWYWLVFALALLLLEVVTGSTYMLWPATAAMIVGLLAIFPFQDQWQLQLLLFAGLTILLIIFAGPRIKPWLHKTREDHQLLNERGARKIGRVVAVDQGFESGVGQVRLDDTLWRARSEKGENFAAGTMLEIIDVEGAQLIVRAKS